MKTDFGKSIIFHLKLERKINYLKNICNKCGLRLIKQKSNKYKVELKNFTEKDFRAMFYNKNKEKTFPLDFFNMSFNQFDNFIQGLMNSDGNYSGIDKNLEYSTTSSELADRLQILASLNNRICTITKCKNTRNTMRVYFGTEKYSKPMYNDSRTKRYVESVNYNGKIYCATVSTGLLMIRRSGFTLLSGNSSPIEHVSFTFGIEGVSRSMVQQLTRHRLASYSQKSQRYVNESDFEYIIPKDILNNKHSKTIFLNAMQDDSIAYSKLHESLLNGYIVDFFKDKNINIDYPFNATSYGREKIRAKFMETNHKKEFSALNKRANENARSILPNACETKIIVTMNARVLLNFLSHRECERAQDEIQQLAKGMLEELIKVAPIVFKSAGAPCRRGKCKEGKMTCGNPKK